MKSTGGYYFGGFSTSKWDQSGSGKTAPGSFLFSLNKKTKHEIYRNEGCAIYDHSNYGPTFGGGHDIYISDTCNQNTGNNSNFGFTYRSPFQYDSNESRNYLAGSYNFQVSDYEVFLITLVQKV